MGGDPIRALTGRRRTRPTSPGCRNPQQPEPGRTPLILAQAAVQTNRATSDRTLGDLPSQGRPVTLRIRVRRFRCLNPACLRRTFAERLSEAARPAARRTRRLGDLQRHLGLVVGGEAGARLAARLAIPTSPDTLLRMARRGDPSPVPYPPPRGGRHA